MTKQLIILDVYGTILKADGTDGLVRPGLKSFLDHYKASKTALFTDARPEIIEKDLQQSGLSEVFDRVYDRRDCVSELVYTANNPRSREAALRIGGKLKCLEKVCEEFEIPKSDTVFIGDNFYGRDLKSTELNGVEFIKVPQFRTNPPDWMLREDTEFHTDYEDPSNPFSFESLIGKIG